MESCDRFVLCAEDKEYQMKDSLLEGVLKRNGSKRRDIDNGSL